MSPLQILVWLGKQFNLLSGSICNTDGAMAMAVAKWLILATGFCTRKRIQSAVGKLNWIARPHASLSSVLAGPCAHSLWGPRFLPHTFIAILRSLASVSFKGRPPLPKFPSPPCSFNNSVFVDAARQRRTYALGIYCEHEGVRFGWLGVGVMAQM